MSRQQLEPSLVPERSVQEHWHAIHDLAIEFGYGPREAVRRADDKRWPDPDVVPTDHPLAWAIEACSPFECVPDCGIWI